MAAALVALVAVVAVVAALHWHDRQGPAAPPILGNRQPVHEYPSAASTGVPPSVPVRVVDGSYEVSRSNIVVGDLDVRGSLRITGDHVTVAASRIRCEDVTDWCVQLLGHHDVLRDLEVGGGADGKTFTNAIGVWSGVVGSQLLRVDVHHTSDGLRIDGNTTVEDSFVHDLSMCCGNHSDAIQTTVGSHIVLRHNTLVGGNTNAIRLTADMGPISDVLIERNQIIASTSGGDQTSYGLAIEGAVSGVKVVGNVFRGRFEVGPVEPFGGGYQLWRDNAVKRVRDP